MPLVFNGVTIPENVANVLHFNGTNVTDVYMNGVQVWHQRLFSGIWSGSTVASANAGTFETSGNYYRAVTPQGAGAWIATNLDGTSYGLSEVNTQNTSFSFQGSGIFMRVGHGHNGIASNWISYDVNTRIFSGASTFASGVVASTMETSGYVWRLLASLFNNAPVAGAWIYLY